MGNVTVRVVPFASGGFSHVGSSTLYASGPVPQLDTVQSDAPGGVVFQHAETHLANYRVILDRVKQRALDPDHSRDFIREAARKQ